MEKIKQMLLNSQLLALSQYEYDEISFIEDINKKRIETEILTKDVANYLIENGANALAFNLEKDQYIIELILNSSCPENIKNIIIKSVTLDKWNGLQNKEQNSLLTRMANNEHIELFKHLCEIGLKLQQGHNDNSFEFFLIQSGLSNFLEQILKFNPEFDLSQKYRLIGEGCEITLLEVVEEEIKNGANGYGAASYLLSLNKIIELIKNNIIIKNHNNLMENLPIKEEIKNKPKM